MLPFRSETSSPSANWPALAPVRLGLLALLFIAELLLISIWLDNDTLSGRGGMAALVREWGAWTLRVVVASALGFLVFMDSRSESRRSAIDLSNHRIAWPLLAAHAAAMAVFAVASVGLYGRQANGWISNVEVMVWLLAGLSGIALAACAFLPSRLWIGQFKESRDLIVFAVAAAVAACLIGAYARGLWRPLAGWTLSLTGVMLRPFVPLVFPGPFMIGTPKFNVEIAPECSGYEGIGLILALSSAWLWFQRRQWRFPRALLLIPAGVATIWILNAARIAALILIGNAGAEKIALGGFHSQAGWISFCLVSLGICLGARRIAWLSREAPVVADPAEASVNPAAVYLMPLLAILAAGLVTRAVTADFEWIYGLRVAAAGAALWFFRKQYRALDWRCGATAFAAGGAVFALWIGLDRFLGIAPAAAPAAFQNASRGAQIAWLALRIIGAVGTVPVAEELAFRGFLMRRIASADFESIDLRRFALVPFVISSVAFGMLHGERWIAGSVAGMIYALAVMRRGRIGDAVVAHAFTNALLAAWVLATGQWQFW